MLIVLIESRTVGADELEERQTLMSSSDLAITSNPETARERMVKVAKANIIIIYEISGLSFNSSLGNLLYFVLTHTQSSRLSSIPTSDFFILFTFGMSNRYVSTLCLMAAPSLRHNKELRDQEDVDTALAVTIQVHLFLMVSGLTVGNFASFGISMVVCRCNPFVG